MVLASIVGTSWANPWMGLCWALIIILISWLIAGWSFRLSHFGMVFIWDILTVRRYRFKPHPTENKMFLSRKIEKVPTRTYGRLSRDASGNLILKYRPWLVMAERSVTLPAAKYAIGKAVFYSDIHQVEGEKTRGALLLPPRYRDHEEELVKIYSLEGVHRRPPRRVAMDQEHVRRRDKDGGDLSCERWVQPVLAPRPRSLHHAAQSCVSDCLRSARSHWPSFFPADSPSRPSPIPR
jgi:hypothetical protein